MKNHLIVPVNGDWILLRPDELKEIVIYHKSREGFIDASFINFPEESEYRIKEILPEPYYTEKHKSGRFSIRQKVSSINSALDFNEQMNKVEMGLIKIDEVRDWINEHLKYNELFKT